MKNKIFLGLGVIILIGIIVVSIWGFNVEYSYKNNSSIFIEIGKDFNINDIKAITNEVFPKEKVEIQKTGSYSDNVVIKVNNVTDEQKELLNTKINEKFGLENTIEDNMEVIEVPSFRIRDIVKPYIFPIGITTIMVLIYFAVKFRKISSIKVVLETIFLTAIAELLFAAIVAITRYPVNKLIMPVGVVIYISILTVLNVMYSKQIANEK